MMIGLGMVGIGSLLMFGFWVLAIGGGLWLLSALGHRSESPSLSPAASSRPLEILKLRYAKGDITKEQYDASRHIDA